MAEILVVDDEAAIADLVEVCLKNEGYTVYKCGSGEAALTCVARQHLDLAILDVMLPDLDGFTLCQKIREEHLFPILMLTARDEISDKVKGLDCGADDYMTKPFDTSELLARVRALTRRQGEVVSEELAFGDLSLHLSSHCLRRGDKSVRLGFKEFEVLRLLLQNAKLVTPKDDIIAKVWGLDSEAEDNNVEVYISFLRKKLSFLASQVSIGTVRKVGYFLTTSDEPGSFGGGGMP